MYSRRRLRAKDETGILVHSDFLDGKTVKEAIPAMIAWLEEKGIGRKKVNYKLRDWVFSVSAIGANPSRSYTVKSAAGCRCPRISCR